MLTNPLNDAVWHEYLIAIDSLKIANRSVERAIRSQDLQEVRNTEFEMATVDQLRVFLQMSRQHLDDYFVLLFWSFFERFLFDFFVSKSDKLRETRPLALGNALTEKLEKDIEYWRIEDMLDLVKVSLISASDIGQTKQIKTYRDWIGHNKLEVPKPHDITPHFAFEKLQGIVDILLQNT